MNYLHPIPKDAQEFNLPLPYITLEGLIWGANNPAEKTIIALHGWLDNAMTFINLAPMLADAGWRVIALEMAGHGLSQWRAKGLNYNLLDNAGELFLAIKSLNLPKVTLLGHSLGAIVMAFFTAAKNNLVDKLIMIDSLGTFTQPIDSIAKNLDKSLTKWSENLLASRNNLAVYPTIADAAQARTKGFVPLSYDAAFKICQRGLKPTSGGFCWRTDPRLLIPETLKVTEEGNIAFLKNIKVPVLEVAATKGLILNNSFAKKRFAAIANLQLVEIDAGHHLHLETEQSHTVGAEILKFLNQTKN